MFTAYTATSRHVPDPTWENKCGGHVFEFNAGNGQTIKFTCSGESSIIDMLDLFERYLKACGYSFDDNYIDLVERPTESKNED